MITFQRPKHYRSQKQTSFLTGEFKQEIQEPHAQWTRGNNRPQQVTQPVLWCWCCNRLRSTNCTLKTMNHPSRNRKRGTLWDSDLDSMCFIWLILMWISGTLGDKRLSVKKEIILSCQLYLKYKKTKTV